MRKAGEDATKEYNDNGEQDYDREVERDGTDPYGEVIFGRRDLTQLWLIGTTRAFLF